MSKSFNELDPTNKTEKKLFLKRHGHPFLQAVYINGYVKTIPLKNKNFEEIQEDVKTLMNSC